METRYLPLFVYGTLIPGSRGYGSTLRHAVREKAPAFLPLATMYIGESYPLAVRNKTGKGVFGTVMLIDKALFEDILFELDDYEGYVGEGRSDNLYLRSVARVQILPNDHEHAHADDEDDHLTWHGPQNPQAYVYLAAPETLERMAGEIILSPSGDWNYHAEEWEAAGMADRDLAENDSGYYSDEDFPEDVFDNDFDYDFGYGDDFSKNDSGADELLENEKPKIAVTERGTVPLDERNFRKGDEFDPDDELLSQLRSQSRKDSYKDASYNEDDEA